MTTKRMPARLGRGTPAGDNSTTSGGKGASAVVWPHSITRGPMLQTFRPVQTLSQLLALARWRAILAANQRDFARAAEHLTLFYRLRRLALHLEVTR